MYRVFLLAALLSFAPFTFAEPPASDALRQTQCEFRDHTNVKVEYGSMQMTGRKIFGGLVPYGRVWETGYTRSTTFVTNANLVVGGKEVTSGHYALSTVPGPDKWTLILQKVAGKDGPNRMDEVNGIELLVRRLPSPLESFTISFDQYRGGCVLNLRWEQTEASVLVAETK